MAPPADARRPKDGTLPDQALVTTRIGSGSDHTVFINYLARPVVDMTFDGPYGVYHSAYDSHYWVKTIGDPGFRYHTLMAQLWGTMALRLANADVLPYSTRRPTPRALREFVRGSTRFRTLDRQPRSSAARASARARFAPRPAAGSPHRAAHWRPEPLAADAANRLNQDLLDFERNWAHPAGIPGRPWFKHLLYAPRYTYAAMTLPGITEAAERGDWARGPAAGVAGGERRSRRTRRSSTAAADRLAPSPSPSSLETRLRAIRDRVDGRMAVYVENLATGERVAIDADA